MKFKVILIIAVILGLITSGAVYFVMDNMQQNTVKERKKVSVVVARKDIDSREKIKSSLVQIKEVPKEVVHSQAVTTISNAVGKFALKDIISGEQILKPRLLSKEQISSGLAFNLTNDKRAVTVAVNEISGVAGFLTPGDYVDVISVFSGYDDQQSLAKTVLQNVEVLAVAQDMVTNQNQKPKVTKSVTLGVNLSNAEKLVLADKKGEIRLVLRSVQNESFAISNGTKFQDIVGDLNKRSTEDKQPSEKQLKLQESKTEAANQKSNSGTNKKKIEVIRGAERSYQKVSAQ
ncbi:Flp pilus assembly protein CpaB [Sporohalobacter salinus]|uniref:Flp pilus assembly protein CpaB n=1 Tax=Sporohalobacter salinus TaxID=1494606 RepID=UPI001960BCFE|nr:pilus assembly protein CpaB [Sporohalobacter salinus]